MNSSPTTAPELSVILVVPDCYATIRNTVRALMAQTVHDQLELVFVAPSRQALNGIEQDEHAFQAIRVVEFGEIRTLSAPRAAGVRAASARLVALGEDHAYPEPNWAEALINAHRQQWAAVGAAFLNGNPGLASWISLVMDYGRWVDPVASGLTDDVPGHNTAWKRELLLEYGARLEQMLRAPTIMHWDLQAKGHRLYLEQAAKVRHFNVSLFVSHVIDHFNGSRVFAASRSAEWSWVQRISYVGGSPVLVVRKLRGWLDNIRRAGLEAELLPRAWPLLILCAVINGLGELVGYGFGLGQAEQRVFNYDSRRGPYLTQGDRELFFADGGAY